MSNKQERLQRAQTILQQLGGNMFARMVGLKQPVALERGVQFGIGGGAKDGINRVVVKLNTLDLYDVEYWRVTIKSQKMKASSGHLYADMLAEDFERSTGFYTHLKFNQ